MRSFRVLVLLSTVAVPLTAQEEGLTGFAARAQDRQHAAEAVLLGVPDTASARQHARTLAGRVHVAGTPAQDRTADYVLRQLASYGFDTVRVAYRVYLPHHDSTLVERLLPTRLRLELGERPLGQDPSTAESLWPAMNGYSGAGDVTAPVIYVNYGLAADYAVLDSLGIAVEGKVVLARYGKSYRGIKAREAEARGAAALLLYSDPQDDGYFRGDVYPRGPMRHPDAVQRGSINNGRGDPSTPGSASTDTARRLPLDSMVVVRIPVVPLGYRNASAFLELLDGPSVPQPWQGGLPFRYHVGGGGAVVARVAVWPETGERAYKTIVNTIATLRGTDWPDEMVLAGAHRDSWGHGAVDNVTGVTSLLEAGRALGTAARRGFRPRRSVVLATWDAEEWGLVGSVEYVEDRADGLRQSAVAYLNQDVVAAGRTFSSSATASLHGFVRDLARSVQQPGDTVSVYTAWRAQHPLAPGVEPRLGDLGGGSDFAGFYNHLGIPSIDFGFGGPYGVYHSAYDTYTFVEKFADPDYASHAAAGRMTALALSRLANADVAPLDYAGFGRYVAGLVATLRQDMGAADRTLPWSTLDSAIAGLTDAGARFNTVRDSVLEDGVGKGRLAAANAALRMVEQELTRPTGLVGRPWMRNLVFAADRDNGYANIALPGIAEAARDRDADRAEAEILDLAGRVRAAATRVEAARAALLGERRAQSLGSVTPVWAWYFPALSL